MGELSWQPSGKTAVCIPAEPRDEEQAGNRRHRLFSAFGWCGRTPGSTGRCQAGPPSCSHSPSDGAGGCSFVSPVVSLVTEGEPLPSRRE